MLCLWYFPRWEPILGKMSQRNDCPRSTCGLSYKYHRVVVTFLSAVMTKDLVLDIGISALQEVRTELK